MVRSAESRGEIRIGVGGPQGQGQLKMTHRGKRRHWQGLRDPEEMPGRMRASGVAGGRGLGQAPWRSGGISCQGTSRLDWPVNQGASSEHGSGVLTRDKLEAKCAHLPGAGCWRQRTLSPTALPRAPTGSRGPERTWELLAHVADPPPLAAVPRARCQGPPQAQTGRRARGTH